MNKFKVLFEKFWLPWGVFGVFVLIILLGGSDTVAPTTHGWQLFAQVTVRVGLGAMVGYLIAKATIAQKYKKYLTSCMKGNNMGFIKITMGDSVVNKDKDLGTVELDKIEVVNLTDGQVLAGLLATYQDTYKDLIKRHKERGCDCMGDCNYGLMFTPAFDSLNAIARQFNLRIKGRLNNYNQT